MTFWDFAVWWIAVFVVVRIVALLVQLISFAVRMYFNERKR